MSAVYPQLTKVLPAPDVHSSVVFTQMVEPGPVNHKEPACNDGRPVKERQAGQQDSE